MTGTLPRYLHRIGGEDISPASGAWIASDNPYTGADWCEIARGDSRDADRAVAAAQTAFKTWRATAASARGMALNRLADLVERDSAELAALEVRDNGKLLKEMSAQMKVLASWFRYFGGLADKVEGQVPPIDSPRRFSFTRHEPYGVVAMITPWNSPLLLLAYKLAPALAAGNTAVVKPSEFASVSTLAFAALFEEAGFPSGTVNVVTGYGEEIGAPLVNHPAISKIAFTGSEIGGRHIYESAARNIKPATLELGGKSPNIIFADADLEAAAMGAVTGIFSAAGQSCIAGSRLLLERSIHDRVVDRLVEVAERAQLGDPMNPATNMGPIATPPQHAKILDYIEIAKSEGAVCATGGVVYRGEGCEAGRFIAPTIFTGVTNQMRIAREEVFGPVLAVIPFDDEEEAIELANDTPYGLAAGVWSSDIGRALKVAERIQAGNVWINCYRYGNVSLPFGGYKRSGIGREGGIEAIKGYLQTKSISLDFALDASDPFMLPT